LSIVESKMDKERGKPPVEKKKTGRQQKRMREIAAEEGGMVTFIEGTVTGGKGLMNVSWAK